MPARPVCGSARGTCSGCVRWRRSPAPEKRCLLPRLCRLCRCRRSSWTPTPCPSPRSRKASSSTPSSTPGPRTSTSSRNSSTWPDPSTPTGCARRCNCSSTGTRCCAPRSQLPGGQVVQRLAEDVTLPWREADLAATGLDDLLEADRAEGFDLARPPLLRATLIRDGARHRLLLTLHHIVADGWSVSVLLRELTAAYRGEELPEPVAPHAYLAWLAARDQDAARDAWRQALAGLDEPTRLPDLVTSDGLAADDATGQARTAHVDTRLPADLTAELTAYARTHGLTLSTVVHGAWGLLLGALTGKRDVVFGTTVSGRTTEVTGLDSAVGLFINTVPARVELRPDESLTDLLRRVQDEHSALLDHQHLGLADIQKTAGGGELFDTLVVFENYPTGDVSAAGEPDAPRITAAEVYDAVHYPHRARRRGRGRACCCGSSTTRAASTGRPWTCSRAGSRRCCAPWSPSPAARSPAPACSPARSTSGSPS